MKSATIDLSKHDSRCRGYGLTIPANTELPMPDVACFAGVVASKGVKRHSGSAEVFDGDFAIWAEENHRRLQRGWTFRLFVFKAVEQTATAPAHFKRLSITPSAEIKQVIKKSIATSFDEGNYRRMMGGSGDLVACVRIIHALQSGEIQAADLANGRVAYQINGSDEWTAEAPVFAAAEVNS